MAPAYPLGIILAYGKASATDETLFFMRFSEILTPAQIMLNLKATDRWETIDEMVDMLVRQKCIAEPHREGVILAVKNREKTMSTGIGFGIAIPHASTDAIKKVTGVMGRSPSGINFDALDNQRFWLFVIFLVPPGKYQQPIMTLSNISIFLNDREFRDATEHAATPEEMYQLILKKEG
jgi:mannitol/fructose-specific phosphotransferase system IIA component (Ntr-type)